MLVDENITAYGRFVMVERLADDDRSLGGIIIPETSGDKSLYGRVLNKGNGRRLDNGKLVPSTSAQPGDLVVIRQFEGSKIFAWVKNKILVDGIYIDAIKREG
jgi:co-chaperonin GroES (HSP10)